MSIFDANEHPHQRYNPLKDEWILVSPHRMKRPWSGQTESQSRIEIPRFDPKNPLCPTVQRPNGVLNPDYKDIFIFDNDFPALFQYDLDETKLTDKKTESTLDQQIEDDLFRIEPVMGNCKVMCFHPYSDLTLATMQVEDILKVINKWIELVGELSRTYEWVQILENRGETMGCSNPHPHCQIWSSNFLPNQVKTEDRTQLEFYKKHNKVMLLEYLNRELKLNERIVCENRHWAVLVPYWAVWPFETMILPKRHIIRMSDISEEEKLTLADIMKRTLIRYDNLFKCSFPYSFGFLFAPGGKHMKDECKHWQLHASYLPPLLRSATVRKFMVGYELLAQSQRDLTAERAASQLRDVSDTLHYLEINNAK